MNRINSTLKKILQFLCNTKNKNVFIITIITSLIVHFQLYALMITGPDTLINSMYHQADIWEPMLLRFGLDFIQIIKGNIVSPILATLMSNIFLGLTVILTIDIFKIKNKYFKYITAVLFAVAPNISATLTFFYCSDAYMLGLFLATFSVFILKKYDNKKYIILISGILIAFSMGMYQTYISVTMVLCTATLIIDILNKKERKQIFGYAFKYILTGITGIVLYYGISHIILLEKNLLVSNYSGADSIGMHTLLDIPRLMPEAYKSFFKYYFNDGMIPNTIWHTNLLYAITFAIILISIIYTLIKNKIYKEILNVLVLIFFMLLTPICFCIIEIMVPSVDMHILMACSMIYIFPIFFATLELLPKGKINKIFKFIVLFCSILISWNYMWQDNASYIAIKTMQNQAESTVLRLVAQVEQLDEYRPETPVLILGGLENNEYFNRKNTSIEAKKLYNRTWGFISDNSTIWWGNLDSWRKILYEYVGVNWNLVSEWECSEIFETEQYKSMKYFPEQGSIKIINNTIVIKLSD